MHLGRIAACHCSICAGCGAVSPCAHQAPCLARNAGQPGAPIIFGCETQETGEIYQQRADGLLGLGNSDASGAVDGREALPLACFTSLLTCLHQVRSPAPGRLPTACDSCEPAGQGGRD